MGRTARINILNQTPYPLVLVDSKSIHGHFSKGLPGEINEAAVYFEVTNNTAALIGPKGYAVYNIKDNNGSGSIIGSIRFEWNHPFSGATSLYTGTPDSNGSHYVSIGSAVVKGGHDQTVTITINTSSN